MISGEQGTPNLNGARLCPTGRYWDAVRTSRFTGLQALNKLGEQAGPIIMEDRTMFFLLPPGSTAGHDWGQASPLGETAYVICPPRGREHPPGPYWLRSLRHPFTTPVQLHEALAYATGPGAENVEPDLDKITVDQAQGWNCALCGSRLYSDRLLGTYSTGYGALTRPTELWACSPRCAM